MGRGGKKKKKTFCILQLISEIVKMDGVPDLMGTNEDIEVRY